MKITKNHLYVGLIAAAAAAWCVDTFLLHGGAPQAAQGAPAPAARPVATPTATPAAAAAHPRTLTLAARFDRVSAAADLTDAFAPPAGWIAAAPVAPLDDAQLAATPAAPVRIDADAFRKAHKLTAVFLMGRAGGTAVIDGAMVEVGQRFDGLVLAGVTAGAATLQGQGNNIVLQIDTAAEAAALSRTLSTREKQVK